MFRFFGSVKAFSQFLLLLLHTKDKDLFSHSFRHDLKCNFEAFFNPYYYYYHYYSFVEVGIPVTSQNKT